MSKLTPKFKSGDVVRITDPETNRIKVGRICTTIVPSGNNTSTIIRYRIDCPNGEIFHRDEFHIKLHIDNVFYYNIDTLVRL